MFTLKEIIKATGGRLISGKPAAFGSISTNSKKIKKGALFIPLVGKKFDGHDFIAEALKNGAAGILTSRRIKVLEGKTAVLVKNTLKALQDIALSHRKKFNIPVIGITGSSGKTTTKDMLASIMNKKMRTLKNAENLNNEIGVPLTLLELNRSHKAAVIEMAMQKKGEILELAKIALPDIAVITNIGEAHIMQLKSKKNIAGTKAEILKVLKAGGRAILPADDRFFGYLKKKNGKAKVISFGLTDKADIRASGIRLFNRRTCFSICRKKSSFKAEIPIPGLHNVLNALAASAAALEIGIKPEQIEQGLFKCKLSSKRMELIDTRRGIRVINDTYNANPSSMKAALKVLAEQRSRAGRTSPRRIAVLGDMLELGRNEKKFHEEIGRQACELGADILVSIGKLGRSIAKGARKAGLKQVYSFSGNKEAINALKTMLKKNDIVLAKASRGMRLEEVVEALR